MAEQEEKQAPTDKPARRGNVIKLVVILGLVVVLDGGLIVVGARWFGARSGGSVASASGNGPVATASPEPELKAEILLCKARADNSQSGVTYLYDFEIYGLVPKDRDEEIKTKIQANEAQIKDQVRLVVAGAEQVQLDEPTLSYVRDGVKTAIARILQEDLVDKVLITKWHRIRSR